MYQQIKNQHVQQEPCYKSMTPLFHVTFDHELYSKKGFQWLPSPATSSHRGNRGLEKISALLIIRFVTKLELGART